GRKQATQGCACASIRAVRPKRTMEVMTVAQSTKHTLKKTIVALVDLTAGPGTIRTIKGKVKGLAGAGASRLARAAAAAAVRLEAEGKADAVARALQGDAASAQRE